MLLILKLVTCIFQSPEDDGGGQQQFEMSTIQVSSVTTNSPNIMTRESSAFMLIAASPSPARQPSLTSSLSPPVPI